MIKFSSLKGLILTGINGLNTASEGVRFVSNDGRKFLMEHQQDCCEHVYIESVDGDVENLLNSPILFAEESENNHEPPAKGADSSYTWTFYRIGTIKGTVVIRWFGSSNGYYSESVSFYALQA